jgi:hypothetical protein
MENTALHPIHSPMKIEVMNIRSVYEEPTAASASAPNTRPHDKCICNVVALLQQIAQHQRPGKAQHRARDTSFGKISFRQFCHDSEDDYN